MLQKEYILTHTNENTFKSGKWKALQKHLWSKRRMKCAGGSFLGIAQSVCCRVAAEQCVHGRAAIEPSALSCTNGSFYQQPVLILLIWVPSGSVPMEAFFFWELVSLGAGSSCLCEQEGVGCALLRCPAFGSCFPSGEKEQKGRESDEKEEVVPGGCLPGPRSSSAVVLWLVGGSMSIMRKQLRGLEWDEVQSVSLWLRGLKDALGLHSYVLTATAEDLPHIQS